MAENQAALGPALDERDAVVGLAHDLRSPLNSVLFLAETLLRGQSGPVNALQHRQLSLIYQAALGLSSAANDIVALARGGGKQLMEEEPVPFSIAAVFEGVRDMVLPIAEEKQLGLELVSPPSDRRMGHPVALSRVLLNLTTNALKFSDRGTIEVTAAEIGDSCVEFTVSDQGKGLDPAIRAILSGSHPTAAERRGRLSRLTGFGLSICRYLAGAMGSELRVNDRDGGGTSISLRLHLPVAPASKSPGTR